MSENKFLKPGDGNIKKTSETFAGAFVPSEEQLTPKEPGEPPSAASQSIVDVWIRAMERRVAELEAELAAETVLFAEVRAHKPPPDDAEQSE